MNTFKLKPFLIFFLAAGFFMISCSKDDDATPPKKVVENEGNTPPVDSTDTNPEPVIDSLHYWNFVVTGAVEGEVWGTPKVIIQDKTFRNILFFDTSSEIGFRLNANHYGIPIDFLDPEDTQLQGGGWTATLGTYDITTVGWSSNGPATYYPLFFDQLNDREFGGYNDEMASGTITVEEVGYDANGYGYFYATFEFEAFNENDKVTVTGEIRMKLIA